VAPFWPARPCLPWRSIKQKMIRAIQATGDQGGDAPAVLAERAVTARDLLR
jgi:hypothetical protein